MKISGLSCETKKIFLVFLGHPNVHIHLLALQQFPPHTSHTAVAGDIGIDVAVAVDVATVPTSYFTY